jgi:hypothetical protein
MTPPAFEVGHPPTPAVACPIEKTRLVVKYEKLAKLTSHPPALLAKTLEARPRYSRHTSGHRGKLLDRRMDIDLPRDRSVRTSVVFQKSRAATHATWFE